MTAFFKEQLQVWFIENKQEADKASEQILVKRYGVRSIVEMNAVMRKRALAGLKKTATAA